MGNIIGGLWVQGATHHCWFLSFLNNFIRMPEGIKKQLIDDLKYRSSVRLDAMKSATTVSLLTKENYKHFEYFISLLEDTHGFGGDNKIHYIESNADYMQMIPALRRIFMSPFPITVGSKGDGHAWYLLMNVLNMTLADLTKWTGDSYHGSSPPVLYFGGRRLMGDEYMVALLSNNSQFIKCFLKVLDRYKQDVIYFRVGIPPGHCFSAIADGDKWELIDSGWRKHPTQWIPGEKSDTGIPISTIANISDFEDQVTEISDIIFIIRRERWGEFAQCII